MQAVFNTTARGFGAFFEDWDIILTPITALPTPKVGTTEYLTISATIRRCWTGSAISGAISPSRRLPICAASPRSRCRSPRNEHGLPLGIQAIGKQANDGLLLQLAAQIERAIGAASGIGGKTPGVHVTRD